MRLIDADALKDKMQQHHDFYVMAWGGFGKMPIGEKKRVDEITNCIAEVVNAPTIDAVSVDELKAFIREQYFQCDMPEEWGNGVMWATSQINHFRNINTDRKTEPQYSEDDMYWLSLAEDVANGKMSDAGANQAWLEYINHKTEPTGYNLSPVEGEPTISKMEQVDEPSGYKTKPVEDEPQTERPWGMYIVDHPMYE